MLDEAVARASRQQPAFRPRVSAATHGVLSGHAAIRHRRSSNAARCLHGLGARLSSEGKAGFGIAWLLGIPLPILFICRHALLRDAVRANNVAQLVRALCAAGRSSEADAVDDRVREIDPSDEMVKALLNARSVGKPIA
jgi:hypothetical protein